MRKLLKLPFQIVGTILTSVWTVVTIGLFLILAAVLLVREFRRGDI